MVSGLLGGRYAVTNIEYDAILSSLRESLIVVLASLPGPSDRLERFIPWWLENREELCDASIYCNSNQHFCNQVGFQTSGSASAITVGMCAGLMCYALQLWLHTKICSPEWNACIVAVCQRDPVRHPTSANYQSADWLPYSA